MCQVGWDTMARTADPAIRHCGACKRDVPVAITYAEFDEHAAKGRCVSFEPRRLPLVLDRLIDAPELGLTRRPEDPCLVKGDPPVGRTGIVVGQPAPRGLLGRFLGLFGS